MICPGLLPIAPVFLGDLEALVLDLCALLEAPELLLVTDLQPELDNDATGTPDVMLEIVDFSVGAQPVGLAAESLDPFDKHPPVPRAVENGNAPEARHMAPESP